MRSIKPSELSITIVFLLTLFAYQPKPSHARQATVYWYTPEKITNIKGHYVSGNSGIPSDVNTLYVYGMGSNAFFSPISWNVSDFTGLEVGAPATQYQRGVSDAWYGCTSGQLYEYSAGYMVNSDNHETSPIGDILGMQLDYGWSDYSDQRPWSDAYGPDAYFRLQTYFSVESRDAQSAIQYAQIFVSLADQTTNTSIWYCLSIWDSRGVLGENVQMDTGGTSNANVCTNFMPGMRYCTLNPGSQLTDGTGSGLWYAARITRENLINAITDINNKLGDTVQKHSTDPNDWMLNYIGTGPEQYGLTGWIGARSWEMWAVTIWDDGQFNAAQNWFYYE